MLSEFHLGARSDITSYSDLNCPASSLTAIPCFVYHFNRF
uniref:Uncharacterized protein n=1 Tax=Siphoviridae sp. ctrCN24 TaxID=2827953 RepID=A0A8S5SLE8_9CAUD|nr:MAG TPA: hypothetical protein [Siphoviridae sp. ctrCN24]